MFPRRTNPLKKLLRIGALASISLLLVMRVAAGQRAEEHTWTVYSTVRLDERIERHLSVLAARDQALLRMVSTSGEARMAPAPGGLAIELRLEPNIAAFAETLKRGAVSASVDPTTKLAADGYVIEAKYPRATTVDQLRITGCTWWGIHNALLRVDNLLMLPPRSLAGGLIPRPQALRVEPSGLEAVIVDFPSFPVRGVVEGFYGNPWTHQDRLDILRFEGEHGMNVYYYAPKNDPYHRKLWREPYPPEAQQRLSELAATARRNFVDFCFAISPGLSMAYSSEQDFQALTDKLDSIGKLGVSCFALFLDDVPQELQNAQDRTNFKTLAQAHIDLTNRLFRHLTQQTASNRLTLAPTTYTNEWGSRDYLRELGAGVEPGVQIIWTGPKVYSPAITRQQAHEWSELIRRPPLIWDNFPVNDGARWSRFLGPLTGRDPQLPDAVQGLISNPMSQARASMIPLETIADYLWNASAYDSPQSETHAVVTQYGEDAPQRLAPFLKIYGTYYWDDGNFMPLFKERRYPINIAKMQSELGEMNSALEQLRYQRRLEPLLNEITPAIKSAGSRLAAFQADPEFRHLPDGTLQWDENHEALAAYHLTQSPNLNGDFWKWEGRTVYRLDRREQLSAGANLWRGPQDLSARVALAWDASYLYVGVDVTDPDLYQPFFARGIQNGDALVLNLETAFRKNYLATEPTGDEYTLYFSPGDFAGVKHSIFSDEDYLPPRAPQAHNYMQEIYTAWKKTRTGYSGDIAIPVNFFGKLAAGYEIGLDFGVTKAIRPARPIDPEDVPRIALHSKKDRLFPARANNPGSFPRLVLVEAKSPD